MYFSNKNGRTSKERRRVLDSHSFHLSIEQTSSTNDRLVCAFVLAQNFNPTKRKKSHITKKMIKFYPQALNDVHIYTGEQSCIDRK